MAAVPHQQCTIKVIHDGQGGSYALNGQGETGEQMHLPEVWKLLFSDNGHAYIKSEGKPARWITAVLNKTLYTAISGKQYVASTGGPAVWVDRANEAYAAKYLPMDIVGKSHSVKIYGLCTFLNGSQLVWQIRDFQDPEGLAHRNVNGLLRLSIMFFSFVRYKYLECYLESFMWNHVVCILCLVMFVVLSGVFASMGFVDCIKHVGRDLEQAEICNYHLCALLSIDVFLQDSYVLCPCVLSCFLSSCSSMFSLICSAITFSSLIL